MKKAGILIIAAVMAAVLCGCTAGGGSASGNGKIKIVTTIFPEYDWVREILGDRTDEAELTLLMDKGVDLHSYQPSVDDILKISACDLFIYVGGESDGWVEDALGEAVNKNMVVISLLDTLGDQVKEEEIVEGMQGDEEDDHDENGHDDHDEDEHNGDGHDDKGHDDDHDDGEGHHHSGEIEYDEHVWLSLKNASVICEKIADALTGIDPDGSSIYKSNLNAYRDRLSELDNRYKDAVASANVKTLLFGDRFPFRYLTDDYGISYYAAFAGCSAETEASFETIVFLAGKVDELGLPAILTIENSDGKIAETIKENTVAKNQKITALDSMQAVTSKDIEQGTTYLSIMQANLEVLKDVLNR